MSLPNVKEVLMRMVEDKELPAYKIASYLGMSQQEADPIIEALREERELSRKEGLLGMLEEEGSAEDVEA